MKRSAHQAPKRRAPLRSPSAFLILPGALACRGGACGTWPRRDGLGPVQLTRLNNTQHHPPPLNHLSNGGRGNLRRNHQRASQGT